MFLPVKISEEDNQNGNNYRKENKGVLSGEEQKIENFASQYLSLTVLQFITLIFQGMNAYSATH